MQQDAPQGTTPATTQQLQFTDVARMTRGLRWVHTRGAGDDQPRPRPAS